MMRIPHIVAYRGHYINLVRIKKSIDIFIDGCKVDNFLGDNIANALDYANLLIDELK